MSPELVSRRGEYSGKAADIWAVGVVVYAIFTGTLPFCGKDEKQLFKKIIEGKYRIPS